MRTVDLTGGAPELNPQFRCAAARRLTGSCQQLSLWSVGGLVAGV